MEDKKVCEKCGVLVSKFAYNRHLKSCTGDPSRFKGGGACKEKFYFTGSCRYCGKECKNSNSQQSHEKLCSKNQNRRTNFTTKGRPPWNKGLTKENDIRLKAIGEALSGRYKRGELIPSFLGKKHKESSKKKLRKRRIDFLKRNPEKAPYLLNHYSKGPSYPEKYFIEVFKNESIMLEYHKQIGLYELDFYNEEKKIDFEVDGEQHYLDDRVVRSDIRRTLFLEKLGWRTIRLRWSHFQKLSKKEKTEYISQLKEQILKEEPIGIQIEKNITAPKSNLENLKDTRWEIIQNTDIDFSKFGWIGKISKIFGISSNKAGIYIKNNFPEFYNSCFVKKNFK